MLKTNELTEEQLKKIAGGTTTEFEIPDALLESILGYTWEQLTLLLGPFLEYANEKGCKAYVKEVKGLLESKTINTSKIVTYVFALNALSKVAVEGGFTEVSAIVDNLVNILSLFS